MKYYIIKERWADKDSYGSVYGYYEKMIGIVEHKEVAEHFCEQSSRYTYEEVTIDNLSDKTSYWE